MARRFSKVFKLNKQQWELDFVDIPVDTDIPLYVDPYAISISSSEIAIAMHNRIVSYFDKLISAIYSGDDETAIDMLSHLNETNATHLGQSSGTARGNGIAGELAESILERLKKSKAAKTNTLKDISDFEMMVHGIGADRISDMVIAITKDILIEYTNNQCTLWEINTEMRDAGPLWNDDENRWESAQAPFPIYRNRELILVPKDIVRLRLAISGRDFYDKSIVSYLKAEYEAAGKGVVRLLKKGTKKVVLKKDIKQDHPFTKDIVADYASKFPQMVTKYKSDQKERATPLAPATLESRQEHPEPINAQKLITTLKSIPTGNADASNYHNFIIGALTAIFYPSLTHPHKERDINDGRKRIDITFNNSWHGFFKNLSQKHSLPCPYILAECKNYSSDPENPEFDQLAGRFSPLRGRVGLLVCRTVSDKKKMIQRCKDFAKDRHECIIVLTDDDIASLLTAAALGEDKVADYMETKVMEIML